MTRINCVPVDELTREHLVAEYRELPRIYALASAAFNRNQSTTSHPAEYRLGNGHVLFFYSRLGYIANRHRQLIAEMRARGYAVNFPNVPDLSPWPESWRRDWQPSAEAMALNRARIAERLTHSGLSNARQAAISASSLA